MAPPNLPPFAPFPPAAVRAQILQEDWDATLAAWSALAQVHLSLPPADFTKAAVKSGLVDFLVSFASAVALEGTDILLQRDVAAASHSHGTSLLKAVLLLTERHLASEAPEALLNWEVLANLAKIYRATRFAPVLRKLSTSSRAGLERSLAPLKKSLIRDLGRTPTSGSIESLLARIAPVIHASPSTAAFLLAGSDFTDGMISAYPSANPSLRNALLTTFYLSLLGLTEPESDSAQSKWAMLTDQLYALKAAAATSGGADASLVLDLISTTPLLEQIRHRATTASALNARLDGILTELTALRRPGGLLIPLSRRRPRRKVDKGKAVASADDVGHELHVHRMSQISQIQDLFPELGSGFVARLLDAFSDDNEQVIAALLEDKLPDGLRDADRAEELSSQHPPNAAQQQSTRIPKPQLPIRHNIHDNDDLDRLAVDTSRLHFGKHNLTPSHTSTTVPPSTTQKAAILSALAAFDSDSDERDDTYDADDVGGTVDAASTTEDVIEVNEEALFRAHAADPTVFARDAATRRAPHRHRLREETGMTDEAIEGWAVMLARNPAQRRRLEARFGEFASAGTAAQNEIKSTRWQASPADSAAEESGDHGEGGSNRGRGRGRGRGGFGGGRGSGGNVAGPSGAADTEAARRRKEASKSSRANHNRRDQRARKLARGGFPG